MRLILSDDAQKRKNSENDIEKRDEQKIRQGREFKRENS
jgi:hypothetical protein